MSRPQSFRSESAFRIAWVALAPLRATTPFQTVAVSFWLIDRGGSFTQVGLAVALPTFAALVGIVLGGWLTDRSNPLRLLLWQNIVALCIALTLLLSGRMEQYSEVAVIATISVYGLVNGLSGPAARALTPRLLDESRYNFGNSVYSSIANLATIIGPLFGGVVYSSAGFEWCILANIGALLFGAIIMFVLSVRTRTSRVLADGAGEVGFIAGVTAALKFAVATRWLLVLMGVDAVIDVVTAGLFQTGFRALSAPLGGSAVFGVVMAAYGIGAIAGAWAAGQSRGWGLKAFAVVMVANIGQAPLIAVLPIVDVGPMLFMLVWVGALNGYANVVYMSFVFSRIPASMAGRVSSLLMAASLSLQPVGIACFGAIVDVIGVVNLFLVCAGVLLVVSVVALVLWRGIKSQLRLEVTDGQ
ncbi:MFS transporter [Micrococcus lylae]|uniref:MFS transporter n=1 Tax=Micrococcus lylae TaxID=1273 RepID=UPI0015E10C03|nr:MFS transporter [Micrococcus lylae]WIK82540.1 MFS transporter [Micrococcus lylae]